MRGPVKEFKTVSEMLAYPSRLYRFAICWNGHGNDGIRTVWMKTENPDLEDNGFNIRRTDDGTILERTFIGQHATPVEPPDSIGDMASWVPILGVVEDGERRVLQLVAWTGGEEGADPPESGMYLGSDGYVTDISEAVDIRGPQGVPGADSDVPGPPGEEGEQGPPGPGLPPGGSVGQVPAKSSSGDYETQWAEIGSDDAPVIIRIGGNVYRLVGVEGDNATPHPTLVPYP